LNLIKKSKTFFVLTNRYIHLSRESPMLPHFQAHWHKQSLDDLLERTPESIHFSGLFAVSSTAAENIREETRLHIQKMHQKIKASTSEDELVCLNQSVFNVGQEALYSSSLCIPPWSHSSFHDANMNLGVLIYVG